MHTHTYYLPHEFDTWYEENKVLILTLWRALEAIWRLEQLWVTLNSDFPSKAPARVLLGPNHIYIRCFWYSTQSDQYCLKKEQNLLKETLSKYIATSSEPRAKCTQEHQSAH